MALLIEQEVHPKISLIDFIDDINANDSDGTSLCIMRFYFLKEKYKRRLISNKNMVP